MKVFVSVGTHPQQFNRLLKEIDRIAGKKGAFEFFAQTGNSDYEPRNFPTKRFLDEGKYARRIGEAGIVISHGGAGTIISCLKQGKKVVVVPRLKKFSEHTNDHQLDLARALASENKVISVERMENMEKAMAMASSFRPNLTGNRKKLVKRVSEFIDSA